MIAKFREGVGVVLAWAATRPQAAVQHIVKISYSHERHTGRSLAKKVIIEIID